MTASRHRTPPQPHRDYQCDEPWFRQMGQRGHADDWPIEAQRESRAAELRRRYLAGGTTYKELAHDYELPVWTVGRIVRGERWPLVVTVEAA